LAFRGTAPGGSSLLDLSRDIMAGGFLIGAGVTAVFAVWEYLELPFPYPERWKPEHMPPVPPSIRQPGTAEPRPVVKIMGVVLGLFFLTMALFWPAMFWVWNRRGIFGPSATVYAMRLPLLLLALLWISQIWLNSTRFAEAGMGAVSAHRRQYRGIRICARSAVPGRFTDSRPEHEYCARRRVGESESVLRGCIVGVLHFFKSAVCA